MWRDPLSRDNRLDKMGEITQFQLFRRINPHLNNIKSYCNE